MTKEYTKENICEEIFQVIQRFKSLNNKKPNKILISRSAYDLLLDYFLEEQKYFDTWENAISNKNNEIETIYGVRVEVEPYKNAKGFMIF